MGCVRAFGLISTSLVLIAGCGKRMPAKEDLQNQPGTTAGGPEQLCTDLKDNDGDGLTDCLDPDCGADGACAAAKERSLVECSNGSDDDGDGKADCADSDCADQVICGPENAPRSCSDLLDNDGDGSVDCDDSDCAVVPACSGNATDTEATNSACSDGDDNDGDTYVDCEDTDCAEGGFGGCAPEEAGVLCGDSLDNDGDGYTDCADWGCDELPSCAASATEADPAACMDGDDNDNDGLTDCADPGCRSLASVNCSDTEEICDDTVDNDADGTTDCADIDCADDTACGGTAGESGPALCADGQDNDGDVTVDCADAGCKNEPFCGPETSAGFCSDTIDNDADGTKDCADSDCAALAVCLGESNCTDAEDNDGDSMTDCADSDCANDTACGSETGLACADDSDNDGDTLVDCADTDCATANNCASAPAENCANGTDDDADGYVDCADFECLLDFGFACTSHEFSVHQLQNAKAAGFPASGLRGDNINDPARLRSVVVTYVPAGSRNFFVADKGQQSACNEMLSGCYHGLLVYAPGDDALDVAAGDLVDLAGLAMEFVGETELLAYAYTKVDAPPSTLATPQSVTLAKLTATLSSAEQANDRVVTNANTGLTTDPADDTLTAERFEGSLVATSDLQLEEIRTEAEGGAVSFVVRDATVGGAAFTIGTRYYAPQPTPGVGSLITKVTGIMRYTRRRVGDSFETSYRLEPRSAADWTMAVVVVDSDGDGLSDNEEAALGTDPANPDTDYDEFFDLFEVVDVTSPSDVDEDGVIDALESFLLDRDGDNIPNEFDAVALDGPNDDRDGDGLVNSVDPDDDNDGVCDPGVGASATCGLVNGLPDNCPYAPEALAGRAALQKNSDHDLSFESESFGVDLGDAYDSSNSGDACDFDRDGDTLPNVMDNCPDAFNLFQDDSDDDSFGDACDAALDDDLVQTFYAPLPCALEAGDVGFDAAAWGGLYLCDLIFEEVLYNLSAANGLSPVDANRDGTKSVTQDEFIEIRNVSGWDLDLSGLQLHDWASWLGNIPARHVIPAGTVLRSNERLLVFGGGGPTLFPTGVLVQTATSGNLGFSNDDDLIVLTLASGDVLAHLGYGVAEQGEPNAPPNVSITRYPDGDLNWIEHPARTYYFGGEATVMSVSPHAAPDNGTVSPSP